MRAYYNAKHRCENKNHPRYSRYGGRGIKFKFSSFKEFIEELGYKKFSNLSLDRIDNDGNYEIGNCRWATPREQNLNKTYPQKIKSNISISIKLGGNKTLVSNRLRRGWSFDKAISTPAIKNKNPAFARFLPSN